MGGQLLFCFLGDITRMGILSTACLSGWQQQFRHQRHHRHDQRRRHHHNHSRKAPNVAPPLTRFTFRLGLRSVNVNERPGVAVLLLPSQWASWQNRNARLNIFIIYSLTITIRCALNSRVTAGVSRFVVSKEIYCDLEASQKETRSRL